MASGIPDGRAGVASYGHVAGSDQVLQELPYGWSLLLILVVIKFKSVSYSDFAIDFNGNIEYSLRHRWWWKFDNQWCRMIVYIHDNVPQVQKMG